MASRIGTTATPIQASGIEFGGIGSVFAFGASATYQFFNMHYALHQ